MKTLINLLLKTIIFLGFLYGLQLITNSTLTEHIVNLITNEPHSYKKAIRQSAPAVVNIITQEYIDNELVTLGSASGVIIKKEGYILTNYHVITHDNIPASIIKVQLRNGKTYSARLIGLDKRTDIGVIKIDTKDKLPTVKINHERTIHLGDIILAIGNPYNLGQTITNGIISATGRTGSGITRFNTIGLRIGLQELIQIDAPIYEGNSGGAIVNTNGEFIGITTATLSSETAKVHGVGFAIPYKLALAVMNEIITNGRVIRGYLGLDAREANIIYKNKEYKGIVISNIHPLGPSKDILKINDFILEINDEDTINLLNAMQIVADTHPGNILTFKILRDGQFMEKSVKVVEQPHNAIE